MKLTRRMCLVFALGVTSVACGPQRPSALANLPSEVDVVFVPFSDSDARDFGFLDASEPLPSFSYRSPRNERISADALETVQCAPRLGGSGMCPAVELRCVAADGQMRVEMELRRDGWISARLGPPWDATPDDLVETRLLVESNDESPKARVNLDAQLVEGMVDASSLQIRGQFRKADSPWFGQLSTEGDKVFVAIHESHPHYEQVLLTLSLVGKIWAANSPRFVDCGFSR